MNRALWRKAVSDAWLLLVVSCLFLALFGWVFTWLMSLFQLGAWGSLLNMFRFAEPALGFPIQALTTRVGQLSVVYVHVVTLLVCVGWAVGRGSDSICGEIGRGTLDLVLSLPVRRASVLLPPAVVAAVGAALLPLALWTGTALGVATVHFDEQVPLRAFLPGAVNLFCMVFCLTGITTFVSSFNRDRWRVIAVTVGFFVISTLVKIIGRFLPEKGWLDPRLFQYASILTAFEPQRLILVPDPVESLRYNGILVAVGLLCYLAGAVILSYRDIPTAR
jgi:ABC-2 type transport system permease protein